MAHRQTWALSQEANKSSGTCSSCNAVRQLHLKDGTIHRHGPRHRPCPGSDKPPLTTQTSSSVSPQSMSPSSPSDVPNPNEVMVAAPDDNAIIAPVDAVFASSLSTRASAAPPSFSHPHVDGGIIKHIPKSARPNCAALLSSLLRKVTNNTNDLEPWSSLLNFSTKILCRPARTGARHNLASIITKRTNAENDGPNKETPTSRALYRKRKQVRCWLQRLGPRSKTAT